MKTITLGEYLTLTEGIHWSGADQVRFYNGAWWVVGGPMRPYDPTIVQVWQGRLVPSPMREWTYRTHRWTYRTPK
jgi:hypothetical protein